MSGNHLRKSPTNFHFSIISHHNPFYGCYACSAFGTNQLRAKGECMKRGLFSVIHFPLAELECVLCRNKMNSRRRDREGLIMNPKNVASVSDLKVTRSARIEGV